MKRILLFLCFLTPFHAFSGDKNKPLELTGSWKEIRRMDGKQAPLAFADTIRINFLPGNAYAWKQAGSYIFKGTYSATPGSIDLGMRQFLILQRNALRMLLKDDANIYELVRYTELPPAEDNTQAKLGDRKLTEEHYDGVTDMSKLTGKWSVYKRTSAVQQETINYDRIIREIRFGGKVATAGKLGSVFSSKDPVDNPSWSVDHFENSTLYCKGRDARELKVLKCADGELIVQEGNITYFFKQF